jgi:electron transfer flavoprotein beta subunit
MDIIVCVKRVPDVAEAEVDIDSSGRGIQLGSLGYVINEWDNFAVEAAVSLVETHGGKVTAITVGEENDEEVLRRALAMGADEAIHLTDPAFEGSDSFGIATILNKAIADIPYDLVLTGAVSGDVGGGRVGPMLAAMAGIPHVCLATELSVEGNTARVRHEVEGGLERVIELDLPALVTVQTGMNEPRYVSVLGIRKAGRKPLKPESAADIGIAADVVGAAGARVTVEEMFLPPKGEAAEILTGEDEETVAALVERLRQQGGI